MKNADISSRADLADVESRNAYDDLLSQGFSEREIMKRIAPFARDNSRTPLPWTSGRHGGFTCCPEGPWYPLQDDYLTCNIEVQLRDERSVLAFYRRLIALCKGRLFSLGRFELISRSNPIIYRRFIGGDDGFVVINTGNRQVKPEGIPRSRELEIVLSNLGREKIPAVLEPWECLVLVK